MQHDMNISNDTHLAVRGDMNDALLALVSQNSGATEPGTTFPYMWWADTTKKLLKRRNAADSAWLVVRSLDESFVLSRSSNTTLVEADYGKCVLATSTFTQALTAAATLVDGWYIDYRNDGTGIITIDPDGSETIDGATTIRLYPGESCRIWCNGTAFRTVGRSTGMVLLESKVAVAASVVDFIKGINSDFDSFVLEMNEVVPGTDSVRLYGFVSTDGGSTFLNTNEYAYTITGTHTSSGAVNAGVNPDNHWQIDAESVGNNTGEHLSGSITFRGLSGGTLYKGASGTFTEYSSSGRLFGYMNTVMFKTASAINGIRIAMSGGTISGKFSLYGIRK